MAGVGLLEKLKVRKNGIPHMLQKVVCIGFHKTGISSMNQVLSRLGYRVHSPMDSGDCLSIEALLERGISLAHRYDACGAKKSCFIRSPLSSLMRRK
jgi:hypothetical protein